MILSFLLNSSRILQLCCNNKVTFLNLLKFFFKLKSVKYITNNSDFFGVLTCMLCLIHCISSPLIYISFLSLNTELSMSYSWWYNIDYVFVLISFFLVYFSVKSTRVKLMKYLFWLSWITLSLLIINEKTESFKVSEYITYFTVSSLSLLHIYNLKFCK